MGVDSSTSFSMLQKAVELLSEAERKGEGNFKPSVSPTVAVGLAIHVPMQTV